MANVLPPPPINDQPGSFVWMEWYRQLRNYISQSGSVPWSVIDFSGSNITDITSRNHNNLQNLQGGTFHLTKSLSGTTTYDFASIATTVTATTTVTVSGAVVADSVILTVQTPTDGIVYDAYVSSANTVTIRATNIKTVAVDPANSLYTVKVIS
jgi:hypothetical protein